MPLVLVPLVPILVGLFLYAALKSYQMTNRAQLGATASRKPSFLKTAAFLYKASGIKWVLHVTHVQQAVTSRFALAHFPLLTGYLHGHTARVNAQANEFAHLSSDTSIALGTLRHKTMPKAINAKVAPVAAVATGAAVLGRRSISLGKKETNTRRRSIDRLNKKLGALAGLLLGADLFIFGRHAATHHRHHTHTIPKTKADAEQALTLARANAKGLARARERLNALEKIATVAGVGALVWRIFKKWDLRWLRCTKVRKAGHFLCGMHSGLFDFLLGLGAGMFAFAELCRLVETIGLIAARVLPKLIAPLAVAGAALCDGEHSAAGALPLQTTALPTVDSPLTF